MSPEPPRSHMCRMWALVRVRARACTGAVHVCGYACVGPYRRQHHRPCTDRAWIRARGFRAHERTRMTCARVHVNTRFECTRVHAHGTQTDARLRHVTHPSPAGGLEEEDASAREEGRQSGRRRRDGCADAATRSGLRRDGLGATLLRKEALRLGCYAVAKRGPKFEELGREGINPGST